MGRPSGAGESLKALPPRLLMAERGRQPPPALGPDAGPPADPEGHLKSARREWMPTGGMEAEESGGGRMEEGGRMEVSWTGGEPRRWGGPLKQKYDGGQHFPRARPFTSTEAMTS